MNIAEELKPKLMITSRLANIGKGRGVTPIDLPTVGPKAGNIQAISFPKVEK